MMPWVSCFAPKPFIQWKSYGFNDRLIAEGRMTREVNGAVCLFACRLGKWIEGYEKTLSIVLLSKFFLVAQTNKDIAYVLCVLTSQPSVERQIMNSSRRVALTCLFGAMLAAVLTACGGGDDPTPSPAVSTAPGATSCVPSANSKVGKSARLRTLAHLVSGTATIVDSCTIEITNFNYDGLGLAQVFVYGGLAGNFRQGFPIGPNLRGTVYTGQTLRLALRTGDIDKLDSISIWCVDANANFGDVTF
jgi:hypothetical protein